MIHVGAEDPACLRAHGFQAEVSSQEKARKTGAHSSFRLLILPVQRGFHFKYLKGFVFRACPQVSLALPWPAR